MSRYPSESVARFDQQFREEPGERQDRQRVAFWENRHRAAEIVLKEALDKLAKAIAALELIHDYGTTCNSRGDVSIPGEYWEKAAAVLDEIKRV